MLRWCEKELQWEETMRVGYDSCTSLLSSVSGINVKIDLGGEGELCTMYAYDDVVYTGMLSGFFSQLNCSFSSCTGIYIDITSFWFWYFYIIAFPWMDGDSENWYCIFEKQFLG